MSTSKAEAKSPQAVRVKVSESAITVSLADGRTVTAPIAWYPRLLHASVHERRKWELIGEGEGIHWPDLDEDISVEGLLAGRASGESQRSFEKWLGSRRRPPSNGRPQPPARRARQG